jgi:putative endonuclease
MASRTRVLYIGVTNDIERRVRQHKKHINDGFTDKYHCERLVFYEPFARPSTAIRRETQLKTWRREKKLALIAKDNARWQDLSSEWGKLFPLYSESKPAADSSTAPALRGLRSE